MVVEVETLTFPSLVTVIFVPLAGAADLVGVGLAVSRPNRAKTDDDPPIGLGSVKSTLYFKDI